VSGGYFNTVPLGADWATVGGGDFNFSTGNFATVPGGQNNAAGGQYSFAAGRSAKANWDGGFVWADSQNADFAATAVNQFLIRASGGVGIGTASPGKLLQVGDSGVSGSEGMIHLASRSGTATGNLRDWEIGVPQTGDVVTGEGYSFVVRDTTASPTARFLIQWGTGNVGIGTTSPNFTLEVNGSAGKPGGGSWSVASDARLKKNIHPLAGALDKLLALHGVRFEYIDPQKIHELSGERMGLVAQEVENVFPDWVETGPDGYKRVTVRGLEALVVEALRQLRQEENAEARELNQRLSMELKRKETEIAEVKREVGELRRLISQMNDKLNAGAP
jgi:hypothetical protein